MSGERCSEEIVNEHGHFDVCDEPATGHAIHEGYEVYPACDKHRWAPVADAVRAERERIVGALRERTPSKVSWSRGHLAAGYGDAINCIEQLPPADGNTEEEG